MLTTDHASWGHTASTGLGFTHEEIVDAHFAACAPHYRAALDEVGLRPGLHVLDAGCGSGAFLPWLCDLVGPDGRISAIDLAEENAALAAERLGHHRESGTFEVRQGDVGDLPYEDDSFDAVWCANTTQYLDDAELARALAEFRRVVRPGGLVAVKDLDASLISAGPGDPFQFTDFFRRAANTPGYARQLLRTRRLHRALEEAGLVSVRQRTTLIEHHAPLEPAALDFYTQACASIARQASDADVPGDWAPFLDPDGADHPLRRPHGYISEGNTLAVGTVPALP
ncbi:Demethylmenaquinone methyltransferase [Streptomyces hundungensis]|uniref:Demethylmenaquinone methyltransferase n=1 Tax=Streptomyces hundungensis TaxID=1077946 RepID=A0A387HC06_9ACTN|nr:methyltransferase domain-containing protein [Streptomyces hundungensis]AYG79773.1 Demethylmenaquinone methyltransferase [Streptomyces hundungensis]